MRSMSEKHIQQQITMGQRLKTIACGHKVSLDAQVREDEARKTAAKGSGTPEENAGAAAHVGGPQKAAGV